MKMVQLMAKLAQERMYQKNPLALSLDVVPQFLTPYQRHRLQVDSFPLPFALRYFTAAEVAFICGIHRRTVNRWAGRGWITPYRPYRNVTYYIGYELLDVERLINIMAQ